ncbi:MAG: divalent-cation tolerance protein CutA [Saprospiraceae bacterium]|nr:divalent-cation tolerance protein CutA [Saprospiraceae bacterium]
MAFAVVYITCPSEEAARSIGRQLVSERLAACANLFPITSMYWWENKIQSEGEWVAIVKTALDRWEALRERAIAVHPYEVPCVMKIEVEANASYEAWIKSETRRDLQDTESINPG